MTEMRVYDKAKLYIDDKEVEGVVFGSVEIEDAEAVPVDGDIFDGRYEVNIELAGDAAAVFARFERECRRVAVAVRCEEGRRADAAARAGNTAEKIARKHSALTHLHRQRHMIRVDVAPEAEVVGLPYSARERRRIRIAERRAARAGLVHGKDSHMRIRGKVTSAVASSRGMLMVTADGVGRNGGARTRHRETQVASVEVPLSAASAFPFGREVEVTITARAR